MKRPYPLCEKPFFQSSLAVHDCDRGIRRTNKSIKKFRLLIYATSLAVWPSAAFADTGIPMIMLMYPALILTLVPVILLETEIFRRRMSLPYKKLLGAVAAGNAASTILGYPLSWAILLGVEFLSTRGFALGLRGFWAKVASVVLQAAWLAPYESQLYWMIPTAAFVGLIPAYFISVYSEGFVIGKILKESREKILPISWVANLWSYGLLVILCMVFGAYSFSKRGNPPEITNFSPKSIILKSSKPFFYEGADKGLKYASAGVITASDRVIWKGEVDRGSLVSPDSAKILIFDHGEAKVISVDGSVEPVVKVESMWELNKKKRNVGTEYWRAEGFQWSEDSAALYLIKDVKQSGIPSQWFSTKASLYRFHLHDRSFEKLIEPFPAYTAYPGTDGEKVFYDRSINRENVGFFAYDLKSKKEIPLYTSKTENSHNHPDAVRNIFFSLSPYGSEYQSMFKEFSATAGETATTGGLYLKKAHETKSLLSVKKGTGGYRRNGIGEMIIIPGVQFLLAHVDTGNFSGALVFDLKTMEYGKFPEDVRLFFSVTSKDLANRYSFDNRGLQAGI